MRRVSLTQMPWFRWRVLRRFSCVSSHFVKPRLHVLVYLSDGLLLACLYLYQRSGIFQYLLPSLERSPIALKAKPAVSFNKFLCLKIIKELINLIWAFSVSIFQIDSWLLIKLVVRNLKQLPLMLIAPLCQASKLHWVLKIVSFINWYWLLINFESVYSWRELRF